MKSFDAKRIKVDGEVLPIIYTSVEQYTDTIYFEAGKEYSFMLETENNSTGAARMQLFWKTPEIFAKEKSEINTEKSRDVYLPANTLWYDFWTGDTMKGGQTITSEAPIEKIPIFIKAGSILPLGPFVQYSTEKPANPIELRIYPGADGSFTLYEDENDNYNYENGIYSTIDFKWSDSENTLTIGERQGSFPGMLKNRVFKIIKVKQNHGTDIQITVKPNKTIHYTGKQLIVSVDL
jgi:alpha-D-xyloside xylohydrolase